MPWVTQATSSHGKYGLSTLAEYCLAPCPAAPHNQLGQAEVQHHQIVGAVSRNERHLMLVVYIGG